MAAAARSISPHADPLSVAATYLAPPSFGRVDLAVEEERLGVLAWRKGQSLTAGAAMGAAGAGADRLGP